MAIVKMKKLRVVAMSDNREALLKGLLHLGCVEISEPDEKLADPDWAALLSRENSRLLERRSEIVDVHTALDAIKRYAKVKSGMFVTRPVVTEDQFLSEMSAQNARAVTEQIKDLLQKLQALQTEESRLTSAMTGLRPWASLDLPLEMEETDAVAFRLCVCPAATELGEVRTQLGAKELAAELCEVSADKQLKYSLLVYHKTDEEPVQETLRPYSFSMTAFQGISGTAAENLERLERQSEENRAAQERIKADIAERAKDWEALRLYADRLQTEADREQNTERLLTDGTIVFFEGWAPEERMAEVADLLDELGCAWDAVEPKKKEYPDVPVQLKNNWFTRPLNMVTDMYSLPAYDNVDPNPLMAPFFILFYGIMLADMGYGLLMILASIFIMKKAKPNGPTMRHMIPLLGLCGMSTFIMGALTGGFFGDFLTQFIELIRPGTNFALPALFTPLNDTLMILIGSMCLGVVHILTGMIISVVVKIKRGQFMDAVWNEITWWIVFAGIALMVLGITNLVLIAGIVMVVAGPLINGKGFGKITGIFGSLYNNITGYFGDVLSYSRLMALMMAGSVIAQVFNTLGTIPGNVVIFLVIAAVGNILNFGLNLLGCYVHDMRLQCLEFFGKFYEDGGKPFRPLKFHTNYVDIQ